MRRITVTIILSSSFYEFLNIVNSLTFQSTNSLIIYKLSSSLANLPFAKLMNTKYKVLSKVCLKVKLRILIIN